MQPPMLRAISFLLLLSAVSGFVSPVLKHASHTNLLKPEVLSRPATAPRLGHINSPHRLFAGDDFATSHSFSWKQRCHGQVQGARRRINAWTSSLVRRIKQFRFDPMIVFPLIARVLLLVFGFPLLAFAAPSGGRMGGSSFSSGSSSSGSSSWGGGGGDYSRSYGSRGGGSLGLYAQPSFGVGWGGGLFATPYRSTNVLVGGDTVLAVLLGYSAYALLSVRSTIVKLQLAVETNWNDGNESVMNILADLARKQSDGASRQEFSRLLSQVSMMLLRKADSWNAAACDTTVFRGYNSEEAEPYFQRIAVQERTKFEKETQFKGAQRAAPHSRGVSVGDNGATIAVVSIVVALRGPNEVIRDIRSASDVRAVLQGLASHAMTERGENVMALEVMWTPSERKDKLTHRDIITDYPELKQL